MELLTETTEAPPQRTTQQRIPYNSGYGDFCFGRFPNFDVRQNGPLISSTLYPIKHCKFERFLDLPIELRLKIYEMILHPFYQYCEKTKRRYIEVYLRIWELQSPFSYHPPRFSKLWEQNPMPHPYRLSNHRLTAVCPLSVLNGIHYFKYTNGENLLLLQRLSNVNCQLRKELGSLFWGNIHLKCTEFGDFIEMENFLKDRPEIYRGIKSLHVKLERSFVMFENETGPTELVRAFRAVAKHLRLETFSLHVELSVSQMEGLALGTKGKWLNVIRTLNVSKDFQLKLTQGLVSALRAAAVPSSPSDHPFRYWAEKCSPVIEDLIMPDTLRKKFPLTEMEHYLESRLREE